MQLQRIKLLVSKTQLLYQEAALAEIGYQPTYFSKFNPKLYVLKSTVKEYKPEEIIQPNQKVIDKNDEVFDELFKKIINSLHTENKQKKMSRENTINVTEGISTEIDFEGMIPDTMMLPSRSPENLGISPTKIHSPALPVIKWSMDYSRCP